MSKNIKKAKEKAIESGANERRDWLKLGEKKQGGGVKSTGFHKLRMKKEPTLTKEKHYHSGVERQVFEFLFEEEIDGDAVEKKWTRQLFKEEKGKPKKDEEGNLTIDYLIDQMEDIDVGEWFGMELKRKGDKNITEITYPLEGDSIEGDDLPEVDDESLPDDKPEELEGYDW